MIDPYYKTRQRKASAGGAAPAVPETWVYYYDGQTIKRRKISDTAGTQIETVSSNATAIFNGLMSGIGFDFALGSAGKLCVGLGAADPDHLYEIDLLDDSETNISVAGHDWIYDVEAQPDVNGGRWLYSDNSVLKAQPYGGGTPVTLHASQFTNWMADDEVNDCILVGRESSGGVRRYDNRVTPEFVYTVHSGITARGLSVDKVNKVVFYGDRTADKLWKTQYLPTIGTPVELDAYGPKGMGAVDYVPEDDKVYYGVDSDIKSINPDGTGVTTHFTLTGTLGQNTWGAKFIHTV